MRVPNQYPIVSRVERWRVNLHTSIVHSSSVGLAGLVIAMMYVQPEIPDSPSSYSRF